MREISNLLGLFAFFGTLDTVGCTNTRALVTCGVSVSVPMSCVLSLVCGRVLLPTRYCTWCVQLPETVSSDIERNSLQLQKYAETMQGDSITGAKASQECS